MSLEIVTVKKNQEKNEIYLQPYYAVKCNSDVVVLRTLAALGVNFDCASREEIDTVSISMTDDDAHVHQHGQLPQTQWEMND